MIGEGQRYFDALRNNETIVRYKDEGDKGYHYSLIKESQTVPTSELYSRSPPDEPM
ncbi:hypothetical protein NXY05_20585 [Bacteroides fragilis]|nr:hypothetical protein [Bacteroides fragilis]